MRNEFRAGELTVSCFDTREEMGCAEAREAADVIRKVYQERGRVNIVFASSPSQIDVLNNLLKENIDWRRVNAFHMDEYVGLDIEHPGSFANYIRENFLKKINPGNAFYINGMAEDPEKECRRYEDLLLKYPTDITFAGIGENGHLAFNDPDIADFFESALVKINRHLDAVCRQQQINDGWFKTVDEVPESAITLTFPSLLKAPYLFATVPGRSKSAIVKKCIEGPICLEVPGSIIRVHRNAKLFIDKDSSAELAI
jgi:glucosamine-6-phosphate deaminase